MLYRVLFTLRMAFVFITLLVLSAIVMAGSAAGPPPKPPKELQRFELDVPHYFRGHRLKPKPFYSGYFAIRTRGYNPNTQRTVVSIDVSSPFHGSIYYPDFVKGQIVPMFGYLYRVTGRHAHILEWIPGKDIPQGIGVRYDSYVIPLPGYLPYPFPAREPDGWSLGSIALRKIESVRTNAGTFPVATLDFSESRPTENPFISRGRNRIVKIHIGERLPVGEKQWFVRNIVPHDKERHLIGWVEISPVRRKQYPAVVEQGKDTLTLRRAKEKDALKSPQAWLSDTFQGNDGKLWMAGVWTVGPREEIRFRFGDLSLVRISSSPFTTGDMLPLFDRIYVVESLSREKIVLRRAKPEELPQGAVPQKDSVLVPFRRARGGHPPLTTRYIQPDAMPVLFAKMYDTRVKGVGVVPVVKLYGWHPEPVSGMSAKPGGRSDLIKNLPIDVVNVVQPDDKKGIIGWVELSP